jgi:hypothetical protein
MPLVKCADGMCSVHLSAVSHSKGKLLLLLRPSLTVTGKAMKLHNTAVSMKRENILLEAD